MKKACDIMTRNVWSVVESTDLLTFTKMLRDKEISGCPVLDRNGRPIGVVSQYDLLNLGGREMDLEDRAAFWHGSAYLPLGYHTLDDEHARLTVGDIMTPAVYSVEEETPIAEVCDFFVQGQIHRVLVTKDGELSGIITATDLIRGLKASLLTAF